MSDTTAKEASFGGNTRGKALPALTHSLKAATGFEESNGYVNGVFIREAENKFGGMSLKINIPEGSEPVVLVPGTYYINPRKDRA